MSFLNEQDQNDFLTKWIHGQLTTKELNAFVTSNLYKNLVVSTLIHMDSKKENL